MGFNPRPLKGECVGVKISAGDFFCTFVQKFRINKLFCFWVLCLSSQSAFAEKAMADDKNTKSSLTYWKPAVARKRLWQAKDKRGSDKRVTSFGARGSQVRFLQGCGTVAFSSVG